MILRQKCRYLFCKISYNVVHLMLIRHNLDENIGGWNYSNPVVTRSNSVYKHIIGADQSSGFFLMVPALWVFSDGFCDVSTCFSQDRARPCTEEVDSTTLRVNLEEIKDYCTTYHRYEHHWVDGAMFQHVFFETGHACELDLGRECGLLLHTSSWMRAVLSP